MIHFPVTNRINEEQRVSQDFKTIMQVAILTTAIFLTCHFSSPIILIGGVLLLSSKVLKNISILPTTTNRVIINIQDYYPFRASSRIRNEKPYSHRFGQYNRVPVGSRNYTPGTYRWKIL